MTEIQPFAPESGSADLPALLTLERFGPDRFRNRYGETNPNGRSYGGQVLGQAMMAASMTVSEDRLPSMMQFLFLQGARPTQPMDFEVDSLQEGKRFSSRLVRATQDSIREILSAQVTFGMPLASPEHSAAVRATGATPQDLDAPSAVLSLTESDIGVLGGYAFTPHPLIDFRIVDTAREDPRQPPSLRFWIKSRGTLPDSPGMHAAAFAYLSDWWINFICLAEHVPELATSRERLYLASLNHTIWFHRPFRSDGWLHFDCQSPSAGDGRGLATARVHDESGRLVASVAQECLMSMVRTTDPAR